MEIGNLHYGHFNAQKHESIRQNIWGDIFYGVRPTKLLGTCHPAPFPWVSAHMPASLIYLWEGNVLGFRPRC